MASILGETTTGSCPVLLQATACYSSRSISQYGYFDYWLSDQKIWLHPLNKGQLDHLPAKINYIENGTTIHVIQFKGTFVFYLGGNSIWKIRAGDYEFRQNSGFYFRDVDAEVESIKVLR